VKGCAVLKAFDPGSTGAVLLDCFTNLSVRNDIKTKVPFSRMNPLFKPMGYLGTLKLIPTFSDSFPRPSGSGGRGLALPIALRADWS